jgi:putative intracellular protease/amidase
MKIAVLLFDRITALDAIGPYEVLSRIPGAELVFVGAERGLVRSDNRVLGLEVAASFDEVPAADLLVVPGGFGTRALALHEPTMGWIRGVAAKAEWVTSVCTGSLLLGAAGLLEGKRATTHWSALETLREYGAIPTEERVVQEGRLITAAGVSAGIDMALTLTALIAGDVVAQAIQLGIEYDPQPPFRAGSPRTAPTEVLAAVRERIQRREAQR